MIVAESTRTRRLVGRLDRGADLLIQLADICRRHHVVAGELRATGAVEDATVGQRRLPDAWDIVSLAGNVTVGNDQPAVQAWVSLSRERMGGSELVGGRLVAARVISCDFVIDAFDDLPVEKPKASPSFEAPARTTWSDVVAASAASDRKHEPAPPPVRPAVNALAEEEAPSSSEPVSVRPGDFIDHPKFGRCAVERVDGDQEFVTARLRNQRLIRLSLDVLTLIPAGQADGKNLFRAVAGK
ncbi:MAG TPA: PPC domain-containing DNA-binding protein [Polyangia bacterium]|nr:PPC domain-containing DNA-binding protein [Polyangia bacterium]